MKIKIKKTNDDYKKNPVMALKCQMERNITVVSVVSFFPPKKRNWKMRASVNGFRVPRIGPKLAEIISANPQFELWYWRQGRLWYAYLVCDRSRRRSLHIISRAFWPMGTKTDTQGTMFYRAPKTTGGMWRATARSTSTHCVRLGQLYSQSSITTPFSCWVSPVRVGSAGDEVIATI